ncbi:flavin-containing monooxygenase [Streptomyces aidingensis]|uniref:Pyridine nucleotide-disulphide oxidoreductase n=1 Tax=Streptomyces aidingensis TaxID=910347 RepID=A0A1I1HAB0_9ACTN|nr:NAD(P)/FAD-dependent oxidoreductase [Streptomyces aidingensis]SFC20655.1 Pyridine nucleotide-disulphide oxidoreductase [Streptomyces aidingensis]
MPIADTPSPVCVIGAGPGGLATAAALRQRGVRTVVVEKGSDVGTAWRGHYDRLRLHTTRRWSALPGLSIPRSAGRWVARDDFVSYLEQYARHHRLELATGVEVSRIEAAPGRQGWLLSANGGRELRASSVIVATGYNHTPRVPRWPGRDGFTGELLHAARYREPSPYRGKDVLVVGVGNTGAEIAADLAGNGAGRVRLAVRTAPHIVRRSTLGWPAQASGVLCRRLPVRLVDRLARPLASTLPDLSEYGLPRPETGLYSRVLEGAIPVQDAGLVRAVRRRLVEPVAAVQGFEGGKVLLADGEMIGPEVVICATGYRRGLETLVGHLGVLDGDGLPLVHGRDTHPAAPGLRFTGFTNPISGMLRELAREAPRIAAAVARELSDRGSARRGRERAAADGTAGTTGTTGTTGTANAAGTPGGRGA